ncbi:MAG TPA: BlaI/MecI/CopY family transcriptional regulator [Bryobacteraceae bacterium]|jgi:predicted transcriptional regulator
MPGAKKTRKPLSELEHLVMGVIWARSSATTAEDVREALATQHPMKDSTVRTMLKRLEDKGYLEHRVAGRSNVYRSLQPAQNVAVKAVQQIIQRLCGGSVEQLLIGMVDDQVLNEQELHRLAKKIMRRKQEE